MADGSAGSRALPGWLVMSHPESGFTAIRIVQASSGRFLPDAVVVERGEVTSRTLSTALQGVPVVDLDYFISQGTPVDSVQAAKQLYAKSPGPGEDRYPVLSEPLFGRAPTFEELRQLAEYAPQEMPMRRPAAKRRPRLRRPNGLSGADFYAVVADAYREYGRHTGAPAVAIAEEAGVPVGTVHRWIREARRRNLLPPGRQGRAG